MLVLYNSVSTVRFEAGRGSTGDVAKCLQEVAARLRGKPGVTAVDLLKGSDGQVLPGGDRSRAFVVFGFTRTSAEGEAEERVRRLECRTLVPGEAVLLIQQAMLHDDHEEQMQALEELLDGLVLPEAVRHSSIPPRRPPSY